MSQESPTRSELVLARERAVAEALAEGAQTLADTATKLELSRNHVYGALWRLRLRGYVERVRVGTRVPLWQLTTAGATHLGVERPEAIVENLRRDRTQTETD